MYAKSISLSVSVHLCCFSSGGGGRGAARVYMLHHCPLSLTPSLSLSLSGRKASREAIQTPAAQTHQFPRNGGNARRHGNKKKLIFISSLRKKTSIVLENKQTRRNK